MEGGVSADPLELCTERGGPGHAGSLTACCPSKGSSPAARPPAAAGPARHRQDPHAAGVHGRGVRCQPAPPAGEDGSACMHAWDPSLRGAGGRRQAALEGSRPTATGLSAADLPAVGLPCLAPGLVQAPLLWFSYVEDLQSLPQLRLSARRGRKQCCVCRPQQEHGAAPPQRYRLVRHHAAGGAPHGAHPGGRRHQRRG